LAARKEPGNQWTDKAWRDAIRVAVLRAQDDPKKGKKLAALADALVNAGLDGDVPALKEIGDRLDGKVAQAMIGGSADDPAIRVITEIRRSIVDPRHQDG
jgi:hypothetical protein